MYDFKFLINIIEIGYSVFKHNEYQIKAWFDVKIDKVVYLVFRSLI